MSIIKAPLGLMHLEKDTYRNVADIKTIDVPEEFFNKTFTRHLMLRTGETSSGNERAHALHENHAEYRFSGTRYRGDLCIDICGAVRYFTNLKIHLTVKFECFTIRVLFALYSGLSRTGIWVIIDGITNDRQHEQETELVEEKISHRRTNEASVIRAAMQEHRADLVLAHPAEKVSDMKKDEERCCSRALRYFMFLGRDLERMAEKQLSRGKMKIRRNGRLS